MLRPAVPADLPRLLAIRDGAAADALSDPALMGEADLRRWVAAGAATIWEEDGEIAGFAAIDGAAIHLLVDPQARGKGVGRELLDSACVRVREAGAAAAIVTLAAGGNTERHYRGAGWIVVGRNTSGGMVLKKPF